MVLERWIAQRRLGICRKCPQRATCQEIATIFCETSGCPLGAHPPRDEEIAAKAWPPGAERISGCCDRVG
jgi:hypothetical protein